MSRSSRAKHWILDGGWGCAASTARSAMEAQRRGVKRGVKSGVLRSVIASTYKARFVAIAAYSFEMVTLLTILVSQQGEYFVVKKRA